MFDKFMFGTNVTIFEVVVDVSTLAVLLSISLAIICHSHQTE
jgi:hypothetical protein